MEYVITMVTNNLTDPTVIGTAEMKNGDILTFDALPVNSFSLFIPSLPNVQFFLQKLSLPQVSVNEVNVPTRFVDYNEIGEKMIFEPFTVEFKVDRYARNYTEVFNWMKAMTVEGSSIDKSEDIILLIDGEKFISFSQAWPTSLSGIEFDSTIEEIAYVTATVEFNYDYFDMLNQFASDDSVYK